MIVFLNNNYYKALQLSSCTTTLSSYGPVGTPNPFFKVGIVSLQIGLQIEGHVVFMGGWLVAECVECQCSLSPRLASNDFYCIRFLLAAACCKGLGGDPD